jgi:ribosome-associated protein
VSDALEVTDRVSIPRDELSIRASRSGGAGGQHVNTSSTRIELLWNVAQTRALPDDVRERVLERLRSRTNADGLIRIVSSEHRSQLRNREAAEARLVKLVRGALAIPRARRKTAPTRASKEARLEAKKRRSEIKKRRGSGDFE